MSRRIFFDGLNLSLERGTGIATYTRLMAGVTRELGHEVGIVCSAPRLPATNWLTRKILRGADDAAPVSLPRQAWDVYWDQLRAPLGIRPSAINPNAAGAAANRLRERLPRHDHLFVVRNLFANARRYYSWSGHFLELAFEAAPDILHCTYQMPLRARNACNVYTIHDLVPLRLPFATLDNKRQTYRLLRQIAAEADHIVTVSENSKRDIVELLGIPEERVTNTYEAVEFPRERTARPDDIVADQVHAAYGLDFGDYLLFYGALEPKKNIGRLIEAYLLSGVDLPLVIAGADGWGNHAEIKMIAELNTARRPHSKRRIHRVGYVRQPELVDLIRGARAVLFPSLYEGFGLPVVEAMLLGTPVVTSRASSLPEIAGDAALYVNPYAVDDIARGIQSIAADAGLRAELARLGRVQAARFSVARYRERIAALYERLG